MGGAVTQGLDWHWIFWVNVPIGILALALSLLRLSETHGGATRLDLPGVALITVGAAALVWGLVFGNEAGWSSGRIVGPLALGALLIAVSLLGGSDAVSDAATFPLPAQVAGGGTDFAFLLLGIVVIVYLGAVIAGGIRVAGRGVAETWRWLR